MPESRPPCGQPGSSFVAKCPPHFWKVRFLSHRAYSSEAVASGERVCSFVMVQCVAASPAELPSAPAQPTNSTRDPTRTVPTTAISTLALRRCPWRTMAHSSFVCDFCYRRLRACHTTNAGAALRKPYSPECVEGQFSEVRSQDRA
jgi:hypothetical protein